jgi:DNA-binding YbaB/EbfC family protein
MLKGLGDIGQLMKMQKEFKDVQKRIQKANLEGDSGNGEVMSVVNGDFKLVQLTIDEKFFETADRRAVEKMVIASISDAVIKVKNYSAEEMKKLTGGMDIPGLGGLMK